MNKETKSEIKEAIAYNRGISFDLLKEAVYIYIKLCFSNIDEDLKFQIKSFYIDTIKRHYKAVKDMRSILMYMKKTNIEDDEINDILAELEELVDSEYLSYVRFMYEYDDLLFKESFNKFNYKLSGQSFFDDTKKEDILKKVRT